MGLIWIYMGFSVSLFFAELFTLVLFCTATQSEHTLTTLHQWTSSLFLFYGKWATNFSGHCRRQCLVLFVFPVCLWWATEWVLSYSDGVCRSEVSGQKRLRKAKRGKWRALDLPVWETRGAGVLEQKAVKPNYTVCWMANALFSWSFARYPQQLLIQKLNNRNLFPSVVISECTWVLFMW